MRPTTLVLATVLIPNALALAAAPAATSTQASDAGQTTAGTVREAIPEQLDPNVFRCGPILAKDPTTRTRIEGLYREQFDLRQNTMAQLKELAGRAQTETDSAARMEMNKQGGQLKRDLERRNMELGLEIARLNADAPRVAEYEKALDQLLHPEKYVPVLKPDAEAQARRARELERAK